MLLFFLAATWASTCLIKDNALQLSSAYDFTSLPLSLAKALFVAQDDRANGLAYLYLSETAWNKPQAENDLTLERALLLTVYQSCESESRAVVELISLLGAKDVAYYKGFKQQMHDICHHLVARALALWRTDQGLPACAKINEYQQRFNYIPPPLSAFQLARISQPANASTSTSVPAASSLTLPTTPIPQVASTSSPIQTPIPQVASISSPIQTPIPQVASISSPIQTPIPQVASISSPIQTPIPQVASISSPIQTPIPQVASISSPIQTPISQVASTSSPPPLSQVASTSAPIQQIPSVSRLEDQATNTPTLSQLSVPVMSPTSNENGQANSSTPIPVLVPRATQTTLAQTGTPMPRVVRRLPVPPASSPSISAQFPSSEIANRPPPMQLVVDIPQPVRPVTQVPNQSLQDSAFQSVRNSRTGSGAVSVSRPNRNSKPNRKSRNEPDANDLVAVMKWNAEKYRLKSPPPKLPSGWPMKRLSGGRSNRAVVGRKLSISDYFSVEANAITPKDEDIDFIEDPRYFALHLLYDLKYTNLTTNLSTEQWKLLTEWALIVSVFQKAFHLDTPEGKALVALSRLFPSLRIKSGQDSIDWDAEEFVIAFGEMKSKCSGLNRLIRHALTLWSTDSGLPPSPRIQSYQEPAAIPVAPPREPTTSSTTITSQTTLNAEIDDNLPDLNANVNGELSDTEEM